MEIVTLTLQRQIFKENYTLGTIFCPNGMHFPTIEDKVRPNGVKVYGKTAIPYGRYKITLEVKSPKFSQYRFYLDACDGFLPRLLEVPNFEGVLLHCGRNENQSSGCIILNEYNAPLEESKEHFKAFYKVLKQYQREGNELYINITQ